MSTDAPVRTYHHGDLRHALIAEGLTLARTGGPAAVTLREATRGAGVSPNAAYRHFADRDDLLRAVAGEAQLALARAIGARVAAAPPRLSPAEAAIERLRRVGLAYIDFARAERGWFALAFATQDEQPSEGIVTLDDEVVAPFQLLLDTLDLMVETGALDADRRPFAEWACWASVHGFAEIAANGPLQWQPPAIIDGLAASVVESAITGVRGTAAPPS
ncbi:AcrR family transcriptional regulator [Microbacterium terrae]|uniref:DNA-binding transcriptional repressor FabR n=1 Tax=Microbacterium terrae TaxID=69369 RepID=A0A0M2H4W7_9MICO|nr:TetR/AcrR family transcriptional regulator [Microbacterium terrae]KJL38782.1 DNA-binding transcriptional repressor FabR [Microbacterium terrae]MBP1076201.1 AcrR family transcriptional regulator [Microbacterium terrae]GLJ97022.1 TetR family transcriptional regulator [Microbacterium terrae]